MRSSALRDGYGAGALDGRKPVRYQRDGLVARCGVGLRRVVSSTARRCAGLSRECRAWGDGGPSGRPGLMEIVDLWDRCSPGAPDRRGVDDIGRLDGRRIGPLAGCGVVGVLGPPNRRRVGCDRDLWGRDVVGAIGSPDGAGVADGAGPATGELEFRATRRGRLPCGRGQFCDRDACRAGRGHSNRRAGHGRARPDDAPRPGRRRRSSRPRSGHRRAIGFGRRFGDGRLGDDRFGARRNRLFAVVVAADERFRGRDGCLQLADRARGLRDESLQGRHHRAQFARVDPRRLTHDVSRLSSSGLAAVRWPAPTL